MMSDSKKLADLLFGSEVQPISAFESKYPPRNLSREAMVTRFAPSPTGFVHIGNIFNSLLSERLARQSGGVFYLRVEDTDKKREVENGISGIISSLRDFGIEAKEGATGESSEVGQYGPYRQSARMDIYRSFIKELVGRGFAYPCFCTSDELEAMRQKQEEQKTRPGYYGEWTRHRNSSLEDIEADLKAGKPFVIRVKARGSVNNKIKFTDQIKGEIVVSENDQDSVLIKSDGLPTYHFAHVVDDYLMKTTHVIRGDEWLPSLPIHLELFQMFGFNPPLYAHNPPILKVDNGSKRKLSKRKDPEAAASFYTKEGYPKNAVIEYLLNILNSNFEDWRKANPSAPNTEFRLDLSKVNKSGAIFDMQKINDVSKNIISAMTADEVYASVLEWARDFDSELHGRMQKDESYFKKIFSIERGGDKPRKDIAKWKDVKENVIYFFDDLFETHTAKSALPFPEKITREDIKLVLNSYAESYDPSLGRDDWFSALKDFGEKIGFAKDNKAYKANPAAFKGNISDLAMIIRVALTGRTEAPDLHQVMSVMGEGMVRKRLRSAAEF